MGVGGHHHAPTALPSGKTQYPLYKRLGGPQSRSGRMRKNSPPPGFDPRTVQSVARRYTDRALADHSKPIGVRIWYFNRMWKNGVSMVWRNYSVDKERRLGGEGASKETAASCTTLRLQLVSRCSTVWLPDVDDDDDGGSTITMMWRLVYLKTLPYLRKGFSSASRYVTRILRMSGFDPLTTWHIGI